MATEVILFLRGVFHDAGSLPGCLLVRFLFSSSERKAVSSGGSAGPIPFIVSCTESVEKHHRPSEVLNLALMDWAVDMRGRTLGQYAIDPSVAQRE